MLQFSSYRITHYSFPFLIIPVMLGLCKDECKLDGTRGLPYGSSKGVLSIKTDASSS